MEELRFEWDAAKEKSNIRKHGISFEEARTAFQDEDNERPLRLSKNERAQKSVHQILETTGHYAAGS